MSALVVSPDDQDWWINNRGWAILLERAMRDLSPEERDELEWYANSIGVNFPRIEPAQHRKVALWLLPAVEALAGPEAAEQGWESAENRAHLDELAVMLRRIAAG
jgi:hypothetical protein